MAFFKYQLEHLERLGGVDRRWLELHDELKELLLEGQDRAPLLVPQHIVSAAAVLLSELYKWLEPEPKLPPKD